MTKTSMTRSTLTIGIDLGDRQSHLCALDESGEVIEEARVATTKDAIHSRFAGLAPARIALEVGGHSAWVSEFFVTWVTKSSWPMPASSG